MKAQYQKLIKELGEIEEGVRGADLFPVGRGLSTRDIPRTLEVLLESKYRSLKWYLIIYVDEAFLKVRKRSSLWSRNRRTKTPEKKDLTLLALKQASFGKNEKREVWDRWSVRGALVEA